MKKVLSIVVGLCMLIATASALPVAASPSYGGYTGPDIMPNGSFENFTGEVLDSWAYVNATQADVLRTTGGTDGSNYVELGVSGIRVEQNILGVDASSAYMLELDYKAAAASAAYIVVESLRNYTKLVDMVLPQADNWTTWRYVVRVREFDNAGLLIRLRNIGGVSVAYDNVKLVKLEGYDVKNLIPDPSFEFCEAGTKTPFTNWGAHYLTSTIMASDGTIMPTSGSNFLKLSNSAVAIDAFVDNSADLDYNAENYSFTLSFDALVYGGGARPNVTVRGYKTDGSYAEYNYNATNGGLVCGNWTWERKYIRLDEVTTSTTNKFRFYIFPGNQPMAIDNVSLIAHKTGIDIFDEDGKVLNSTEGISGSITARAQYLGTESAALYFAVYNIMGDVYKMESIKTCNLEGDGTVEFCTLEDVSEDKCVKAFIWTNDLKPIYIKSLQ